MYLVDVVGVGSSALQEHGGDPHVDESAMSPERHTQTVLTAAVMIVLSIIITETAKRFVSVLGVRLMLGQLQQTTARSKYHSDRRVKETNAYIKSSRAQYLFSGKREEE